MKKSIAILLTVILVLGIGYVSVSADDFIPSSEKNEVLDVVVPEVGDDVVVPDGLEEDKIGAIIESGNDKTAVSVDNIVILSISEASANVTENVADEAVLKASEALIKAYDDIKKSGSVSSVKSVSDAAKA